MRLDRAIDGFWLARRRELSRATQADYGITFRRLVDLLGPECVFDRITAEDVQRLLNGLAEQGLGPKSLLNAHTGLSALWTWAEGALGSTHVVRGVKRPRWRRPVIEPFTQEEVGRLLRACDQMEPYDRTWKRNVSAKRPTALRDRAILLALLDTGLRASELTALRLAVWRYLATRETVKASPLFATRQGTALERAGLLHLVQRIGERAGVTGVHPHRFRHTFAIWFLRNGGNPLELQRMLGHEKLETVLIYVRLAEVDIERAAKAASPVDGWRIK